MLSFAHTPTTRLMAYMAAVLSAAGTLPRLARPDRSTRAHTLHSYRAVEPVFRPLPDEPAVRATNPQPDWLQLAAHYRPVPEPRGCGRGPPRMDDKYAFEQIAARAHHCRQDAWLRRSCVVPASGGLWLCAAVWAHGPETWWRSKLDLHADSDGADERVVESRGRLAGQGQLLPGRN